MDDILISDPNIDSLERIFEEIKRVLPKRGLEIASEKNTEMRFCQLPRL